MFECTKNGGCWNWSGIPLKRHSCRFNWFGKAVDVRPAWMNFAFMPELESRYGYFIVVGAMLTICTGLFIRFKRLGWL